MSKLLPVLAVACFALSVPAYGAEGKMPADSKKTKVTWTVVQAGDEIKVIQTDKLKEVKDAFDKEAKEKAKAEKGAKKVGKKVEAPKWRVVKTNIAAEKDAQKIADDETKKLEKASGKSSTPKKGGKKDE